MRGGAGGRRWILGKVSRCFDRWCRTSLPVRGPTAPFSLSPAPLSQSAHCLSKSLPLVRALRAWCAGAGLAHIGGLGMRGRRVGRQTPVHALGCTNCGLRQGVRQECSGRVGHVARLALRRWDARPCAELTFDAVAVQALADCLWSSEDESGADKRDKCAQPRRGSSGLDCGGQDSARMAGDSQNARMQ